jgi:hypothetical protein
MCGLSSCELNDRDNIPSMQKKRTCYNILYRNSNLKGTGQCGLNLCGSISGQLSVLCITGILFVFSKTGSIYWFAKEESLFYIFTMCFIIKYFVIDYQLSENLHGQEKRGVK